MARRWRPSQMFVTPAMEAWGQPDGSIAGTQKRSSRLKGDGNNRGLRETWENENGGRSRCD